MNSLHALHRRRLLEQGLVAGLSAPFFGSSQAQAIGQEKARDAAQAGRLDAQSIIEQASSAKGHILVVFELSEVKDGTKLVIRESGFDRIPLARRAKAFAANDGGWTHQTRLLERFLNLPS